MNEALVYEQQKTESQVSNVYEPNHMNITLGCRKQYNIIIDDFFHTEICRINIRRDLVTLLRKIRKKNVSNLLGFFAFFTFFKGHMSKEGSCWRTSKRFLSLKINLNKLRNLNLRNLYFEFFFGERGWMITEYLDANDMSLLL